MKYLLPILCLFVFSCDDKKNPSSPSVDGCIDSSACNYNPDVVNDDGSCQYPEENFNCNGECPYWETTLGPSGNEVIANYTDFENNGSVTAIIEIDNVQIDSDKFKLVAFINNDLHGYTIAQSIPSEFGDGFAFSLMIFGEGSDQNQNISFKLFDSELNIIYTLSETVPFENNMIVGNLNDPQIFTFSGNSEDFFSCTEDYFTVSINETAESTLFIFDSSITGLNIGDELGLFDSSGIIDTLGNQGEILVGTGVWTGSQLEITAIRSIDLSSFSGPILPGATINNTMILKIWNRLNETESIVNYNISIGSGTFDEMFSAIHMIDN